MSNPKQSKIQNETEQLKRDISLLQDSLKESKKTKLIAKWAKPNRKNKKWTKVNHKNV